MAGSALKSVPILMYHGINNTQQKTHPYFGTSTCPHIFAQQMQLLYEDGYSTIDLPLAVSILRSECLVDKKIVITFDDGRRDFYTHALPVLKQYQFTATLFVTAQFSSKALANENGKEYMTWSEIKDARNCGTWIGSHTVSHPELSALSPEQVRYELTESKNIIEDHLGEPIHSFSYPYAFPEHDRKFVSFVRGCLQDCGYQNGVSTLIGTASTKHDPFFLPRLPVNSYDDERLFRAKLGGAYDWLHIPQRIYKSFARAKYTDLNDLQNDKS